MVGIEIPGDTLLWGVVALGTAALAVVGMLLLPRREMDVRRRLQADAKAGALERTAAGATDLVTRAVARSGRSQRMEYALDRAGVRRTLPEFLLIVGAITLAAVAVGTLINGLLLGILLGVLIVVAAGATIGLRAERRRRRFADQLDDLTQLLATNLRAGHSLLQSLSALSGEIEEPARSELTRVVNQVRVGRDLGEAIDECAQRMASEDFTWVAQAIAIHRRVGGNLADVLDTVSFTIRERNQVRRQVHALSAEGRMSAVILMALPILVGTALSLLNPIYLRTFTQSSLGYAMLGSCLVLMTLGGLWLWRLTQVEY